MFLTFYSFLLEGGQSTVAGRLAGAFRNIRQNRLADTITKTMEKAGYALREYDPFTNQIDITLPNSDKSPYGSRIRLMWNQMRDTVVNIFPKAPGIPDDKRGYMKLIRKNICHRCLPFFTY